MKIRPYLTPLERLRRHKQSLRRKQPAANMDCAGTDGALDRGPAAKSAPKSSSSTPHENKNQN